MKILMIGPDREVQGGVSTVINNYYLGGLDQLVDLKFIATMKDGSKFTKLKTAIRSYFEFRKSINYCDILHVHMASRASFYRKSLFISFAKKNKKKIIIHMHGAEFKEFYMNESTEKQKKYISEIFNKSDKVIALSEQWKKFLSGITDTSIEVLYNSIVIPENIDKVYNSNQILFLGRLGKRKGVYDLLDVMPKLIQNHNDVKLKICGDGEVEKVRRCCKELSIDKNVEIFEWIKGKEKEDILLSSNIFVLPSYNEGMPMALLEAMSYKNAVISTEIGGIPEVITNEKSGFLIRAGDKEALLNNLNILLSDQKRLIEISENAYKKANDIFNIKNSIKKLIKIYNQLEIKGGEYIEC